MAVPQPAQAGKANVAAQLIFSTFQPHHTIPICDLNRAHVQKSPFAHLWQEGHNEIVRNIPEVFLEKKGDFLVASHIGQIIGMGGIMGVVEKPVVDRKPRYEKTALLRKVRVHPEFWGLGIEAEIIGQLAIRARKLGYEWLRAKVSVDNEHMINILKENGFEHMDTEDKFGTQLLVFEKLIRV